MANKSKAKSEREGEGLGSRERTSHTSKKRLVLFDLGKVRRIKKLIKEREGIKIKGAIHVYRGKVKQWVCCQESQLIETLESLSFIFSSRQRVVCEGELKTEH